jgi:hypothetical protein
MGKKSPKTQAELSPNRAEKAAVSYLDPEVREAIKAQVRKTWERVKENLNLNQTGLGKALNVSQPKISRLLTEAEGSPWTPIYLQAMADYLDVPPTELIPPEYRKALGRLFADPSKEKTTNERFLAECLAALGKYYRDRGINLPDTKLQKLAGTLCERLDGQEPSHEQMQSEIERVVLQAATSS